MDQRNAITRRPVTGQSGVTLVELLVVMAILALAASIVIVNAPPRQSVAQRAAQDFANAFRESIDAAIVNGAVRRLEITSASWRVTQFEDAAWRGLTEAADADGRPVVFTVDIEPLAASNLLALTGQRPQPAERDAPTLIGVDPFGGMPQFTLRADDGETTWAVNYDPDSGKLRVDEE